jgi:hypothetical protein
VQLPPDPPLSEVDDTGLTALFLDILRTACPEAPDRVRWLKGQHYQAAVRITRLMHAWPEPNAAQLTSLLHAEIWYAACVTALNEELTRDPSTDPDPA